MELCQGKNCQTNVCNLVVLSLPTSYSDNSDKLSCTVSLKFRSSHLLSTSDTTQQGFSISQQRQAVFTFSQEWLLLCPFCHVFFIIMCTSFMALTTNKSSSCLPFKDNISWDLGVPFRVVSLCGILKEQQAAAMLPVWLRICSSLLLICNKSFIQVVASLVFRVCVYNGRRFLCRV